MVAQKYYSEFFENDIFLGKENNFVEEFANDLPVSGLIFDLGCGNGQHSIYIAKNKPNCNVIGVDFSSAMLQLAENEKEKAKLGNLQFVCDNMLSFLNAINDKAVGVLAVFSFTCLTPSEIKKILDLIYKALLPNGKVFIAVHEDLQTVAGDVGRFEVVPEIYEESETQYYKYFKECEMMQYLKCARFRNIEVKRLHTSRETEINNKKMCFICQK